MKFMLKAEQEISNTEDTPEVKYGSLSVTEVKHGSFSVTEYTRACESQNNDIH